MSTHTPTPWEVYEESAIDYRPCEIYGAGGGSQVAWMAGGGRKRAIDKPEERANAQRIVACVNGCAGVAYPDAVHDLIEACEIASSGLPEINFANYTDDDVRKLQAWAFDALDATRTALSKAKGKPVE